MDFSRQRTGESLLEGGIPPRTLYVHPTGDLFNGGLSGNYTLQAFQKNCMREEWMDERSRAASKVACSIGLESPWQRAAQTRCQPTLASAD